MGRAFVLFMLLTSVSLLAQDAKPNPADYAINVHVRSSRLVTDCGNVIQGSSICSTYQSLKVEIDGKKYDLSSGPVRNPGVLRTGNYKARVLKEDAKKDYEYTRTYELLFSDGVTRKYWVAGESE
jgi:hypothetical protein